ncbi:MAG: hypothetical protein VST68_11805, partial [Nitrospirota bacterium]|nr:hypothetical protein [Nitrospirota bacterium]
FPFYSEATDLCCSPANRSSLPETLQLLEPLLADRFPIVPVEYLPHMPHKCPRRNRYQQPSGMVKKSPSSKAAASLTRGAYSQYVSTANWRERR